MSWSVKQWQKILIEHGVYDGPLDGNFDPEILIASRKIVRPNESLQRKLLGQDFEYDKPVRNVNELIWHCSATPEGKDFTVEDIDRWHRQRGWSGIGYHFVVYRDGSIHRGRDIEKTGAHVRGHNRKTIGAVYIGGVNNKGIAKDTRTEAQKRSMLLLTEEIVQDQRIKEISGHNKYAAKACPSFDVSKDELGNSFGFKKGIRQRI